MYLRLGEGGEGGGGRPGGGNAGSNRVRYCYRLLLDLFAASLGSSFGRCHIRCPARPAAQVRAAGSLECGGLVTSPS